MSAEIVQRGAEGRVLGGPEAARDALKAARPVYFGNRICPFAHRAWWAAAETGFEEAMDYVHIDLGQEKPAWYQTEVNPFGTVPCLYVEGKPVFESLLVADYINEVTKGSLYPTDPLQKANVKLIVGQFGEKCVPLFYKLLMNQDRGADAALRGNLKQQLEAVEKLFTKCQTDAKGPFLCGAQLSMAEVAMMPFFNRMVPVLHHYRNFHLFNDCQIPTLRRAYEACLGRPAFKKTMLPNSLAVNFYSDYAAGKKNPPSPPAASSPIKFGTTAASVALGVAIGATVAWSILRSRSL